VVQAVEQLCATNANDLGLPLQEATALTIPPFAHLFDAKMPMYIDAEVGQWPDKSNAEVAFCAGVRPPNCVQDRAADLLEFWCLR
jgi:hypothetical protein